jgi:CheY-like chemotaxis protein/two-component sensor histidine kinase
MTIIDPSTKNPSTRFENTAAAGVMRPCIRCKPGRLVPRFEAEVESHGNGALLAVLVHELSNPLACAAHAANVLRNPGARKEADQLEWAVASIERQIHRLTSIVDDVLGVSHGNTGQAGLPFTLVDAATVMECAQESVRDLMETHGHTLTVDVERGSLWLRADAVRLEQVLVNLLTNAGRYTPDGGHIALRAARERNEIVIRVEDSGIGIAEGTIESLFTPFYRGQAARMRASDGLGIGLTVVRRLVELHGGRVEVFSEGVGRGSTFVVRLPAAERSGPGIYVPGESFASPAAFRVLIVDDCGDLADGLSRLLRRRGHRVECAQTGAEALRLAHAFQPEFVLVDVVLPDLSGFEVAAMLPGVVGSKRLRIASFSGYSSEEECRLSEAAGCVFHLQKLVEIQQIEALLAG